MTSLRPLAVPAGPEALGVLPDLRRALEGGAPLLPYAAGAQPPAVPDATTVPDATALSAAVALAVGTSGSTGTPKLALLTGDALAASAESTHERLGGPGQWLLAMPAHHIAGLQVLVRSVVAGTEPVAMALDGGFRPERFGAAAARLGPGRRYTSLVPTQLGRLLDSDAGTRALRRFDAVLVGGAATAPRLLDRARACGIVVVTTYGLSETAGGCVYDGVPLSGTQVRLGDGGRLLLGGATLALGYLGRPDLTEAAFSADADGTRWFATDDVGHRDVAGRWHVDGRLDDLVNTGGLKVAPRLVEEAVAAHVPGVAECVVVGVPDSEWGEAVCAAVVLRPGAPAPSVTGLREALRGILPDHALPRRVVVLPAVPLRGPGKPDRAALRGSLAARP